VILHTQYTLPPGRLDPENATHVPWTNLWLDILALLVKIESELYEGDFDPLPEPEQTVHGVPYSEYGLGYMDRGIARLRAPLSRQRCAPKTSLAERLGLCIDTH